MLNARFVPIEKWPGKPTPSAERQSRVFSASYLDTLYLVEQELHKLQAQEILIQAFFARSDLRNDGWPKNGVAPSNPGVILSFETTKGSLSFPCDRYAFYQDNLRAIGLALKALRAVDRYGVTQNAEQYTGWAQIEAPATSPFSSKEGAARYVAHHAGASASDAAAMIDDESFRQRYYREAARRLHPDAPTGNHELFVKLQQALAILEAS